MAEGWICIHRKIRECDIWDYDEPFSRRDAWIDLLLLANHRDKDTIFDGKKITIQRGQYLTSVRKLSKEWHWGKDKTLKYLRLLEQCEMITREADSRRTLITIVNYSIYQDMNNETADSDKDSKQTVSRQSSATNNNDNNDNNENNNKYICAFDDFWKIYPRKNDKARAYKCYQARLKDGYTDKII
jgi:DNA replication protein DnaD